MQLQIALALSREEAEKANEMEKSDDIRLQVSARCQTWRVLMTTRINSAFIFLQLALEESKREAEEMSKREMGTVNSGQLTQSAVDDLLSLGLGDLVVSEFIQLSAAYIDLLFCIPLILRVICHFHFTPPVIVQMTDPQQPGSSSDAWGSSAPLADPWAAPITHQNSHQQPQLYPSGW